jgi:hypothetical protein
MVIRGAAVILNLYETILSRLSFFGSYALNVEHQFLLRSDWTLAASGGAFMNLQTH